MELYKNGWHSEYLMAYELRAVVSLAVTPRLVAVFFVPCAPYTKKERVPFPLP